MKEKSMTIYLWNGDTTDFIRYIMIRRSIDEDLEEEGSSNERFKLKSNWEGDENTCACN